MRAGFSMLKSGRHKANARPSLQSHQCARIWIWLLALIFLVGGILTTLVYLNLPFVIERAMAVVLRERSAHIEIDQFKISREGVRIEIAAYREPGISIEAARVSAPWAFLLSRGLAGNLSAHISEVSIDGLDPPPESGADARLTVEVVFQEIEKILETLGSVLYDLPLMEGRVEVERLVFEYLENSYSGSAKLGFLRSSRGESVELKWMIAHSELAFNGRCLVVQQGLEVAIDFEFSAREWAEVLAKFFPEAGIWLEQQGADLFLDPVAPERGFLEVSGFLRWSQQSGVNLRGAVLGNLGGMELFMPRGDLVIGPSAFGLAGDDSRRLRAFAEIPLNIINAGTWTSEGGSMAFRADSHGVRASFDLEGAHPLSLNLRHARPDQLLAGDGVWGIDFEGVVPPLELLRALVPERVPSELTWEGSLKARGQVQLEAFQPKKSDWSVDWDAVGLKYPPKELELQDWSGSVVLSLLGAEPFEGKAESRFGAVSVAGVSLGELVSRIQLRSDKVLEFSALEASVFEGLVSVDAFTFPLEPEVAKRFRVHLGEVDLARISEVVPQFEGELSGTVSGHTDILWTSRSGLRMEGGHLELDSGRAARLSYDLKGLLTAGLQPGSPAHARYSLAEEAFRDLNLMRLRIDLFPGEDTAKPIVVHFFGESTQQGITVPVDYTLNVNTNDVDGLIELLQMMRSGELEIQ